MANEQWEIEMKHLATKEGLEGVRTEFHQEMHKQTWRIIQIIIAQTALIIGAMYFMIQHQTTEFTTLLQHWKP
jgi:hypothetical protein